MIDTTTKFCLNFCFHFKIKINMCIALNYLIVDGRQPPKLQMYSFSCHEKFAVSREKEN